MALRFVDSFDHYATADFTQKWTSITSSPTISSGTGRRGTNCFRGNTSAHELSKTLDNQATWIVGFAFTPEGSTSGDEPILIFLDGASVQTDIRLRTDGTLRATRNGTTLATSSNALSAATTYYIETKVTISDASGVVEVRVNGSSTGWINITSQDTKNTANAYANVIRLKTVTNAARFDDLYVCDGTGSANNDFLGDVRVDCYLPSGNGNSSQLAGSDGNSTDNYALVDEASQNGDTDYVQSATASQKDTYAFADMSHTPSSIFGVQVNMVAKKDDSGTRTICSVTRSGGSDTDGATQALATSYVDYREILETDPNTAAAWTRTNLNSAEFGVKVVS